MNFVAIDDDYTGFYIVLDLYCGFEIRPELLAQVEARMVRPIPDNNGFYRGNKIQRIITIRKFRQLLPRFPQVAYENIYIGNDGALHRVLIHFYKEKNPLLKTIVYHDGLIERVPRGVRFSLVNMLEPLLCKFGLDIYIPSNSACSSLNDKIYVMTDSCKRSLIANKSRCKDIEVKEFPRIRELKNAAQKNGLDKRRVLLVLSAFAWHRREDIERWEIDIAVKFSDFARQCSGDIEFAIRSHPRSSLELVELVRESGYESVYKDVSEDILNSSIVLSYASTVLFEAHVAGVDALAYDVGAPYINRGDFVESLPTLDSFSDLVQ